MSWGKARKLPVVVEFREVDGDREEIDTREGTLVATADEDLIIRGVEGEIYPIGKQIFRDSYEVVDQP